jgi:Leucine-rich repeat (LRR) protein
MITIGCSFDNDNDLEEYMYPSIQDIPSHLYHNIVSLKCYRNKLTVLPLARDLPNLKYLECSLNNLTSIPLYPNLEELICIKNFIKKIGDYPKLIQLYAHFNNIRSIGYCPMLTHCFCRKNKIKTISPHNTRIIILDCAFNELVSIPVFPEIYALYCHLNRLDSLPEMPSLHILSCQNNNLSELPMYPRLINLDCSNNRIRSIPGYTELTALKCSYNRLTELPMYPLLVNLDCTNNRIHSILEYTELTVLKCSYNRLTELPDVTNWRNLNTLEYAGNEIEYIPPNVTRFINHLSHKKKSSTLAVFNDGQNVHDHQIQESIRSSIVSIIKNKPSLNYDELFLEIVDDHILNENTKRALLEYSNDIEVNMVLNLTFKELLLSVWSVLKDHIHKNEILEIMNIEMADAVCKCFTGRMSRLINVLNGFDPRIRIEMAENAQIGNIIILIKNRLKESSSYTVEQHKSLVVSELEERGFARDIIQLWVNNIEEDDE